MWNQFRGMIWRDTLLVKPVGLLKDTNPGDHLTGTTLLEKVIRIKFHSLTKFLSYCIVLLVADVTSIIIFNCFR